MVNFSFRIVNMETIIKKIIDHYGSLQVAAFKLDITQRHLFNVRKGRHVGKHLKKDIMALYQKIKEIE